MELPVFSSSLPTPLVLFFLLYCVLLLVARLILALYLKLTHPLLFLEVTPPFFSKFSDTTIEKLFSSLHLLNKRSFIEKFFGIHQSFSLEIVSTKSDGIRYIIGVRIFDQDIVKRLLLSYIPELKIKEIQDPLIQIQTFTNSKSKIVFLPPLPNSLLNVEHDSSLQKIDWTDDEFIRKRGNRLPAVTQSRR